MSSSSSGLDKDLVYSQLYIECREAAPQSIVPLAKILIESFSMEERGEIVSRVRDGCAPLFVACINGNVEMVAYLIEMCSADVEQRGMYVDTEDLSVHSVPPLWCACVENQYGVVRCLLEHGANVNCVSDNGSTPVRSACYRTLHGIVRYLVKDKNADILKPNYDGSTCLMISTNSAYMCDFLIQQGANVNAQDNKLNTALHYAIENNAFDTTKLLLDSGADPFIKNRYGDDALRTACIKCAIHVSDYLCENYNYSKKRMAETHELLGCALLEEQENIGKCIEHWRKALLLRNTFVSFDNKNKRLSKCHVPKAPYACVPEFNSLEELRNLVNIDDIRIQSLLIRERILGPLHRDMIYQLTSHGEAYALSHQYQRCVKLWSYALELQIKKLGLLHSRVYSAAHDLVKIFLDSHKNTPAGMIWDEIKFEDVCESIRMLVCHFDESKNLLNIRPVFKKQQDNFDKILNVLSHQIYILYIIPKTPEQVMVMKQLIRDILQIEPRSSAGDTLLHLVVSKSNTLRRNSNSFFEDPQVNIFPNAGVTELLLNCSANVEAINYNLSTPLHIAAMVHNYRPDVIQVLLRNGAHIDQRDGDDKQPHDMLQNITDCTVNHLQYTTLKCLAARKLIDKNIPYNGEVPVNLEKFVRIH